MWTCCTEHAQNDVVHFLDSVSILGFWIENRIVSGRCFLATDKMEITYVYTKKRADFGRQCNFTDRPAEVLADILPEKDLRKEFIDRNPCDLALQCSNDFSEHEVNRT